MFSDYQEFFWIVFGQNVQITWMATIAIAVIVLIVSALDVALSRLFLKKRGD